MGAEGGRGGGVGPDRRADVAVADTDQGGDEGREAKEEGFGGVFGEDGGGDTGVGDLGDGLDENHQGGDEPVGSVEGDGREHERKEKIVGVGWQEEIGRATSLIVSGRCKKYKRRQD